MTTRQNRSLPLSVLKRKWALMALLGLFFVGCDRPDAEPAASAAEQDAKQVIAESDSPTPDSWADETPAPQIEPPEETEPPEKTDDSWTTAETIEDADCYYEESLNIEVAEIAQGHAQDLADCSKQDPLAETDPGDPSYDGVYYRYNLCEHTANFRLVIRRNNVIEDCFDEYTQSFHEDYCATRLGHNEIFDCLAGKAHTVANWDACAALRDTRYGDAIASGECEV